MESGHRGTLDIHAEQRGHSACPNVPPVYKTQRAFLIQKKQKVPEQ